MRKKPQRRGKYHVYIVECGNGTYYTGHTNDLERRLSEHGTGRGAKYLRGKGPVKLVYAREYRYYKRAVDEERRIKGLERSKKEELVRAYLSEKSA